MDTEQAAPIPNESPAIWDLVIADMQARNRVGRERYGTPLQANNGRDGLCDLYEELLDACAYIRKEMVERDKKPAESVPEAAMVPVHILYANWRGSTTWRRVQLIPGSLHFGSNLRHPEPQWHIRVIDVDIKEERTLALKDIREVRP